MSSKDKPNNRRTVLLANGDKLTLTEKMYKFAIALAKTGDEKEAVKAGRYTPKTYANNRHAIMKRIEPLLFQLQQETEKQVVMDKARVLNEIALIALANPLDYIKPDGTPKKLNELTREQASAVAQFEVTKGKDGTLTSTYKLYNKMQALELAGKHFGMFDAKLILQGRVEHDHTHKLAVDWSKVPTERLKEIEEIMVEEATKQGRILEHQPND